MIVRSFPNFIFAGGPDLEVWSGGDSLAGGGVVLSFLVFGGVLISLLFE